MEIPQFIAIAAFLLAFALVSRRIERTVFTARMVFVGFGLLIGPAGFGILEIDPASNVLHKLAEATLVLALFTDASRIDLRILRKGFNLPLRMLVSGPLRADAPQKTWTSRA